jgi:hypothetical protein
MADPCSIIGVVAVAVHDIHRALRFVEGIQDAPQAIARLTSELAVISQLLQQLDAFIRKHAMDGSLNETFVSHLRHALANSEGVARDVNALLRPYVKPTGDLQQSLWKRFAWTFREQKLAGLQKDMMQCNQALHMSISYADL